MMKWWRRLTRRCEVLFDKRSAERELEDEIRFHIDMEIRQHVEAGVDPREARRRALVAFGGVERFKEKIRDVRGARFLDDLAQDVRVGLRSFLRQPGFLVAVVGTLGIGIGANVAMFGVVDAALFRALPFADAHELALGRVVFDGQLGNAVSGRDFLDFREQTESFAGLDAVTPFVLSTTVTGEGDPQRVRSMMVSPGIFRTLGVRPSVGRDFRTDEGWPGAEPVVMLEHGFWVGALASDPDIAGRTISVGGVAHHVAGVMPPGFRVIQDVDIWRVFREDDGWAQARQFHNFLLVGRLAPDTDLSEAQAEVDVISGQLAAAFPDTNSGKGLHLTRLREGLVDGYRSTLAMLMAAVGLVLLIACGNVAGLLLARGSARRSEMAVRASLGAGRGRLVRKLLTEHGLLAALAGVVGILLAVWIERGLLVFVSLDTLGPIEARLSSTTFLFGAGLSAATVALFGLMPAWWVARSDPADDLRSGSRTAGSRKGGTLRNALVTGEVALTVVLLSTSGLLIRSFAALRSVDPGFETERLLTAELSLPLDAFRDLDARIDFFSSLREEIGGLAVVEDVGLVSALPIRDPGNNVRVDKPEVFGDVDVAEYTAYQRSVMPGYFEAMRIPVLAGRDVATTDDRTATPAIVLSQSVAEVVFQGEDPIGRTVGVDVGQDEPELREVVGVVADVVTSALFEGTRGAMYYPYHQRPGLSMRLAVRARGDAPGVTAAVRDIVRELEPDVPLASVATMDAVIDRSIAGRKAIMTVLALFAIVAMLLAGLGLYSLLAYQVAGRQHEIGVRMALGATVEGIARGVLKGGLGLVAVGLAIGVPVAMASARFIRSALYGVGTVDPVTYVAVSLFLGAVATVACILPALRAARVDPVDAFRSE